MIDLHIAWIRRKARRWTIEFAILILLGVSLTQPGGAQAPSTSLSPIPAAVTTFHNDTFRTGQNLLETILDTHNVNTRNFGKRISYPVDGQIYAQPLVVPLVPMHGSSHNVVYVATEHDSIYAFDADQTTATSPLWHTSFLAADITTAPSGDLYRKYANKDMKPEVGITGTPVIDRARSLLFVVAMTKESGSYHQRLHVLDLSTGAEQPGSPIEIEAQISGMGYDSVHGLISFNPKTQNQRSGLLLSQGTIYISWASFGDTDPYHGWVIGYRYDGVRFLQLLQGVYNVTPNGSKAGIWMGGTAPSADQEGNIYLATGNGTFDLDKGGVDAGDTFVKLSSTHGLRLVDSFTPFNQACLDGRDADLGSGGALLLPDQQGGTHPHLMVGIGKEGRVYVMNRDNMGKYTADPNLRCRGFLGGPEERRTDIDKVFQELPIRTTGSLFGSTAYWSGTRSSGQLLYAGGVYDTLKSFQVSTQGLSSTPVSATSEQLQFSGATPSISSNGNKDGTGIVWTITTTNCTHPGCMPIGPAILHAYDATNLTHELFNSELNPTRNRLDSYVKFSVPTVANGRVFVGSQTSLNIYGLL